MILVFDLDDTLYDELSYVKSGFNAVAEWLFLKFGIDKDLSIKTMLAELASSGRGRIFDSVLNTNGIYSLGRLKECIAVYRHHKPAIVLTKDAKDCLNRFSGFSMYIVTDGNKIVQYNKIVALGLNKLQGIKKIFITHRYGVKHSKPSPYCFQKICKLENTTPANVVYIGDNPAKDFVGLKPLGFKTIRLVGGHHRNVLLDENYEAHLNINSLSELNQKLLASL